MHIIINRFPDSSGVGRPGGSGETPNSSGGTSRDRSDLPGNQNRDNLNPAPNRDNSQNRGGSTPNRAENPRKRGRGFASMDPQRVSEIASLGGKAAHAQGVAHEWSAEEARAAGRKGGQASRGTRSGQQKNLQAGSGAE